MNVEPNPDATPSCGLPPNPTSPICTTVPSLEVPLGKIIGEPNEVYHSRDAVSNTRLKVFAQSPELYRMVYLDKLITRFPSAAFEIGKAFHYRCEGLKVFRSKVAVNDRYPDFKSGDAQRWRNRHRKNGRTVISSVENETISRMVFGFRRNPLAMELLRNTQREVTWRAKIGNFTVQCRTDRWSDTPRYIKCFKEEIGPYFVDFKTVPSLSNGDFSTHVTNFDYHWQDAFYKEVIMQVQGHAMEYGPTRCFFVVTEKEAPWETEVYEIDQDTQALARRSILQNLIAMRRCYETGIWSKPQTTLKSVGLKFWKVKEEELLLDQSRVALT